VNRPRAADDFTAIKARMEELRHPRRAADDFTTISSTDGGAAPRARREAQGGGAARPAAAARWQHPLAALRDRRGARAGTPIWPHTPLGRERDFPISA